VAAIPSQPGSYVWVPPWVPVWVVVDGDVGVGGLVAGEEVGVVGLVAGEDVGVVAGEEVDVVGVGAGVDEELDGVGDADFRTDGEADGLAGCVVTTAGTTIAGEYTPLAGDGEADLLGTVCLADAGAASVYSGATDRS
jgi:hypothetical protein